MLNLCFTYNQRGGSKPSKKRDSDGYRLCLWVHVPVRSLIGIPLTISHPCKSWIRSVYTPFLLQSWMHKSQLNRGLYKIVWSTAGDGPGLLHYALPHHQVQDPRTTVLDVFGCWSSSSLCRPCTSFCAGSRFAFGRLATLCFFLPLFLTCPHNRTGREPFFKRYDLQDR